MPSRTAKNRLPAEADDVLRGLAFLNTLAARPTAAPQEALTSYETLCTWAVGQALLDAQTGTALTAKARRRPSEADAVLRRTRELRELAHAAVHDLTAHRTPPPAILESLTARLAPWYAHGHLVRDGDTLHWTDAQEAGLDAPLWRVMRVVIRALTSPLIARARACAADDCGWWFVDDTKNRSRRWCDMKICGNRAKVRRFRAREHNHS